MKIVFVVPDMPGGGTEKVVSLLADEYVREGMEAAVLMFGGDEVAYPLDPRVEVVSAAGPSDGSVKVRIRRLINMRRYFRTNKGCLIYSFSTIGTGFVVLSTIGLRRRMLVSERTDPTSCDHKPYRNFFYRFARVLVCQTEEARDSFPEYIRRKAVVIPNPSDPALPAPWEGERTRKVVTAGRLEPVKNQEMLIRAFARFHPLHPDYTLHLYGKGSLEGKLRELADTLLAPGAAVFHGFCPTAREEMRDAAMFVLSSNYEGLSNSMAEALAMGVPVIATDCPAGGCRACIRDGENGLLIPVGGEEELFEAMCRLADEPGLADRLSVHGRRLRESNSADKIAGQMLRALLDNTVRHKKG